MRPLDLARDTCERSTSSVMSSRSVNFCVGPDRQVDKGNDGLRRIPEVQVSGDYFQRDCPGRIH